MENTNKNNNTNKQGSEVFGAAWIKKNDKGVEYLSIRLNDNVKGGNYKAFLNGAKEQGDNKPDYILYESLSGKNNNK